MIGGITIFLKHVENRGFLQNSQGGTKQKFSKMADVCENFGRLKKREIQVI